MVIKRSRIPRLSPGASPGTLIARAESQATRLRISSFDGDGVAVAQNASAKDVEQAIHDPRVTWLEVVGLGNVEVLAQVADVLGMSRLALEDVVNSPQRPKLQEFDESFFLILRAPTTQDPALLPQVSFFVAKGIIATFVEHETNAFQPLRERLDAQGSRVRERRHDYLLYRLVDVLVDSYFPHLELLTDRLDRIESEVDDRLSSAPFKELHEIRRRLRGFHRVALPTRDALAALHRNTHAAFDPFTLPFLLDAHDHAAQIVELSDHYRGVASDIYELIQSGLSLRLNEVMRLLTTVATIFIPLSFVVGLYGMNFDTDSPYNMPELGWRFGYPALLVILVAIAFGMAVWIRRQGLTKTDDS